MASADDPGRSVPLVAPTASLSRGTLTTSLHPSISRPQSARQTPLADPLPLERTWCPDEDAMLAALRVLLGMPPKPARFTEGAG